MPPKLTRSKVISRFIKAHSDKYDYTDVDYQGAHIKVSIKCREHGEFQQTPINHFAGHGCSQCSNLVQDIPAIFERMDCIHNSKYKYSPENYQNSYTKIDIVCPVHGVFSQQPKEHLKGQGCPGCPSVGFNQYKPAILYYIKDLDTGLYKVGITNRTVQRRFGSLKGIRVIFEDIYPIGGDAFEYEKYIKQEFSKYRCVNKEWAQWKGGHTEFYNKDIFSLDTHSDYYKKGAMKNDLDDLSDLAEFKK